MDLTGAHSATIATLLLLLVPPLLLLCVSAGEANESRTVREFYIAAVEIGWDYIYVDDVDPASDQRKKSKDIPKKYIKAVYREYTDGTYTVPKPRPAWTGIQGPVIVAQARERVVVHFKNLATQSYSISPVGISYWKQSEGAGYDDATTGQEKEDDAVFPGGYYKYVWDITAKDGPTSSDPECLTYSYSSQVDTVRDVNSGLIGALLICKSTAFTPEGQRRSPAFVLLFAVFDESKSWYGEVGERRSRERFRKGNDRKEYHTINGYVNATLPGLKICQGRSLVIWHLIGMGTAPDIHSIQFQDHSLEVLSHRKVTVEVTPMTFITAEMRATNEGRFMISCQIHAHRHDGMEASFTVERCPNPVVPPGPDQRNVKNSESDNIYDYYGDDFFNTISFQSKKPQFQARASRGEHAKIWRHYIAIEEVTWDYAPHLKHSDSEPQSRYLPAAPHHLDYKYKKAVYVEYTDGSFTQRKNTEHTLLGPLLKGKVSDQIHITLRNLASRAFNIYATGLTNILPIQKSTNAAEKDLRSMGVAPNGTFGYIWKLTRDDGPLDEDPQCLTLLYQSTVAPERDLASGLVGTLLVCKNDAIDSRGRLVGPDKEWSVIFAAFDENRSWYIKDNMQNSKLNTSIANDPEFYSSNVIYSINGIMFSGRQFVICKTDVAFWHVASVGTQSDFLSVYFTGNLFQYQGLYQSVLTLFPMTGVTIPMEPEVMGEWEISAFDGSLKSRGMTIQYTVVACGNGELSLVDHDGYTEDISDYIDQLDMGPRGMRPQNNTMLVRVCKKRLGLNNTHPFNASDPNVAGNRTDVTKADRQPRCQLRRVPLKSQGRQDTVEIIPKDVLEGLDLDEELLSSQNVTDGGGESGVRLRRQVEGNGMGVDMGSGASEDGVTVMWEQDVENRTDSVAEAKADGSNQTASVNSASGEEFDDSNEIVLNSNPLLSEKPSTVAPIVSDDQNYVRLESEKLQSHEVELESNNTADSNYTTRIGLALEYDDYSQEENSTLDTSGSGYINPRSGGLRYYYIAAEEINWDYGIRKPHQMIKPREMRQGMRKFLPVYKKVVFRAYKNINFQERVDRGELQVHLGIMGPFIRTEINDVLNVVFKNKASRPYSFHLQGVYDRSQGSGMTQTHVSSAPPGVPGEPVAPGEARTYSWRITKTQGPTDSEFGCKTGAYYSTVDKERDLHSGLIGPLVICKPNTNSTHHKMEPRVREFSLLFHTFDETKSWYLRENLHRYCAPPCYANTEDPWYHISNKFAAINGYVAETLPGLLVAQHQQVRWHLLNVGSDGEYHAVHFHGLPFTVQTKQEHRMGVYNLYPGVFGTVEMKPSTVGTWLVECHIGDYQLAGMRAKLLVYDPECSLPLGMKSGRIEDSQITASDYVDNWKPQLARLDQSGYINAWMGRNIKSWIQVDLLKPTLLHGVKTQGVSAKLRDNYVVHFSVWYSLDQENWTPYRRNDGVTKRFGGNMDSSKVKHNRLVPPIVARYVRIQAESFNLKPALRLELMGCDLNSCSFPLGLQRGIIPDESFSASSHYSYLLRNWTPYLARLHQEGSVNAWRPTNNNPHEWLQVDLGAVKRITGLVTQGARSLFTSMMVTEFSVTVSHDKQSWSSVLEEDSQRETIFPGNYDADEEALTVFEPPLFGRYLRIHPRGWINDIALRMEVLGCNTQEEH